MASTTRQLPRLERQQSILKGAAEAFAKAGFQATSMEDIAGSSGITKLIVYRHFESKEALYQAVLQQVSDRLAEEFKKGQELGIREGLLARAQLTVARENPAGYSLLWRHAAREPQFETHALEFRERAVLAASSRLEGVRGTRLRRWAAETLVSFLVEAVLNWIEIGSEESDDAFIDMTTRALRSLIDGWSPSP